MRQEKNVIKIKEKKPRKPKKNGSRRAKVEALRASKLGVRGWRYNNIDNGVTKVLNPVTERTSFKVLKVKKNDIPELVRSFNPNVVKTLDGFSSDVPARPEIHNSLNEGFKKPNIFYINVRRCFKSQCF